MGFSVVIGLAARLGAVAVWMALSLLLAMPQEIKTADYLEVAGAFLTKWHFAYLVFLILVDLGLSIVILDEKRIAQRFNNRLGWGVVIVGVLATLATFMIMTADPDLVERFKVILFILLLALYGWVRFLMYPPKKPEVQDTGKDDPNASPSGNTPSTSAARPSAGGNQSDAKPVTLGAKAIPAELLKENKEE